ncbi:MAG: hypothetical protein M1814_003070 [Vezdaea aestivalis]|nr:MAG: hypothetical protein M1814_003070 [Vezdaea aestivalis]
MTTAAQIEAAALFSSPRLPGRHHTDRSPTPSDESSRSPSPAAMPLNDLGSNYHVPRTKFNANTGPKGVIADAQSFEATRRRNKQRRRSPAQAVRAAVSLGRRKSPTPDSEDEELGDEDFLSRWRKGRMTELRDNPDAVRTRRQSPSQRRWGRVQTVDAVGYLDAIEKVGRDTTVVVCIYDEDSEVSSIVEASLNPLAQKYSTTRFVKLHYDEAEMDVASVPAILAYKEGELVANLVSIIDEIPADKEVNSQALESVLIHKNVL